MIFTKENVQGFEVYQDDPNSAWPAGLLWEDKENDRWTFTNGSLGWVRVKHNDILLSDFFSENPNLVTAGNRDFTYAFSYIGSGLNQDIARVLIDGMVVPIRHGYVFVHVGKFILRAVNIDDLSQSRNIPTDQDQISVLFVPETDSRLDQIKAMRNRKIEDLMNSHPAPNIASLLATGEFVCLDNLKSLQINNPPATLEIVGGV